MTIASPATVLSTRNQPANKVTATIQPAAGLSNQPIRIILLGPPGAGKGTQAALLRERFQLKHLSTGDMLRQEVRKGTAIGREAKSLIDKGMFVSDDLITGMLVEQLTAIPSEQGLILDGYPRTVAQAKRLDDIFSDLRIQLSAVLELGVDTESVVERLAFRRSCPTCGRSYHLKRLPSKVANICDDDGSSLVQRPDDVEEVIRQRLETYRIQTEPVVAYYRADARLCRVDASQSTSAVSTKLISHCLSVQ
jgi:adenylate kinase